jgi:hypothetical protein
MDITDGTFNITCSTYKCVPNGNGTTTEGAAIAIAQHKTNKAIVANIAGGTFNIPANGTARKLSVANPQNNAFNNVTVTGLNTLFGESVTVPEGFMWVENGNNTCSLGHPAVMIGNAGYATLKGKTVPVPKIVNAINSGTSFMQKQPFVRKAANTGANKAMSAMKESIQEAFDKMNK